MPPSKAWPEDRSRISIGVLTLDKAVKDSEQAEKKLLFLPGQLPDGIEPSDDPMIDIRNSAYAESFFASKSVAGMGSRDQEAVASSSIESLRYCCLH